MLKRFVSNTAGAFVGGSTGASVLTGVGVVIGGGTFAALGFGIGAVTGTASGIKVVSNLIDERR
ncbi:glycine zipper family protein [Mesobacillus jeotgali]|uniref:Glycine zipper family protein n=1 Tax=Mesobacillus jeotgali TaxID=129985 RepID=A0ABY9VBY9_9BACI|nr:glycine zipper family protein [Mesobacillus jeotgali]WNF21335.1 glycine zipper family protein [Mesobacillus jeotgali]